MRAGGKEAGPDDRQAHSRRAAKGPQTGHPPGPLVAAPELHTPDAAGLNPAPVPAAPQRSPRAASRAVRPVRAPAARVLLDRTAGTSPAGWHRRAERASAPRQARAAPSRVIRATFRP